MKSYDFITFPERESFPVKVIRIRNKIQNDTCSFCIAFMKVLHTSFLEHKKLILTPQNILSMDVALLKTGLGRNSQKTWGGFRTGDQVIMCMGASKVLFLFYFRAGGFSGFSFCVDGVLVVSELVSDLEAVSEFESLLI